MKDVTVTVSGSFHRHIDAIMEAVKEFRSRGVRVISPEDPRIVDSTGSFLFVASDRHRSIRLVQDRHLASISQSTFLWLISPDGYVGQSASLELGFAIAYGIPIYGRHLPPDLTLREYIQKVNDIDDAIRLARAYETQKSIFPWRKLTIKELVVNVTIACYTLANNQNFSLEDEIRLRLKEQ